MESHGSFYKPHSSNKRILFAYKTVSKLTAPKPANSTLFKYIQGACHKER
ncbi:predicted protein [Histoplasma mississippiense (nom. inval.)]|nr:predicted protein [Histoplasma mississippiense (nom. inval.)]EDN04561.1 predicted protein [Histoplasma mississippiense (nom. inval.)]